MMSKTSPALEDDLDFVGRLLEAARLKLAELQQKWDQFSSARTQANTKLDYLRDPDPYGRNDHLKKKREEYFEERANLQEQHRQAGIELSRLEGPIDRTRRVVKALDDYHRAATWLPMREGNLDAARKQLVEITGELNAWKSRESDCERQYKLAVESGELEAAGVLWARLKVIPEIIQEVELRYQRQEFRVRAESESLGRGQEDLKTAKKNLANLQSEISLVKMAEALGVTHAHQATE